VAARADPLANQLQFHKNMNSHSQKWPSIQAKNIKQYYSREFPEISAIFPLSQISASVLNSLWGLKRIVAVTGVPWVIYGIQSGSQVANAPSTQVCLHNEPWYTYRVQV